jgi:hypothetical protein
MHSDAARLSELHDEYVEKVNLAVSEGRDDLVAALSAQFTKAARTAGRDVAVPALADAL